MSVLLLSLALGLGAAPPQAPGQPLVLQADGVLTADGTLLEDASVLLREDLVLAVGTSVPVPRNARTRRVHGILAPGLVDAFSQAGLADAAVEPARRRTPELRAADSLDPDAELWEQALAAGVGAVHLTPRPARLFSGWTALARPGAGGPVLLRPRARPVVSLGSLAFDRVLGPTALAGLLDDFEREAGALAAWRETGVLVVVDSAEAIQAALARAREQDVELAFVCLGDWPGYAGALPAGSRVCLPVLEPGAWPARQIEGWRLLHGRGLRIAFGTFGSRAWAPGALRDTALAFSRATGDPAAALAAVTTEAAAFAGSPRAGAIAPGRRADLVLWTAHPLDASARVQAVLSGGRSVPVAPPPADLLEMPGEPE